MQQAVADANGVLYWKAAETISQWAFGPGDTPPGPSARTASCCYEGNLT
jgi:hypothetical protein